VRSAQYRSYGNQRGIFYFSGKPMVSKEMQRDLETLLGMEIKLRLLDAEGVDIPQDPPPVPAPPSNYEFCYEYEVK
jgi:engulfment and cell motility protein 1